MKLLKLTELYKDFSTGNIEQRQVLVNPFVIGVARHNEMNNETEIETTLPDGQKIYVAESLDVVYNKIKQGHAMGK